MSVYDKHTYEDIELDGIKFVLEGFDEVQEYGDGTMEPYFYVTKAYTTVVFDDEPFQATMSDEFVKKLNNHDNDYYLEIIEQIKEG